MNLEKKEKEKKKKEREQGGPVETHGGSEVAGLRQWGMGTNGAVAGGSDVGMRVSVRVTKGKCVRVWEGLRKAWVAAAEKIEGFRVSNSYIYRGFFVISR